MKCLVINLARAKDRLAVVMPHFRAAGVKLIDDVFDSGNIFCLNLPSGALGAGRLTPRDFLHSRRSDEYYFECLIVDDETFFYCGANPRTLISSAISSTNFSHFHPNKPLRAFELDEQKPILRYNELLETSLRVGGDSIVVLTQSVLDARQTFFVTDSSATALISCVYSLLPARARKNLTVASGLYFADDRSTRLIGVVKKVDEPLHNVECRKADSFLDLRDVKKNGDVYVVDNAWAALVQAVLVSEYVRFFFYGKLVEEALYQRDGFDEDAPDLRLEDVAEVGREWLEELENGSDENDDSEIDFFEVDLEEDGEEWKRSARDVGDDSDDASPLNPPFELERPKVPPKRNAFLDDMRTFSTQIEDDAAKLAGQRRERSEDSDENLQFPSGFPRGSVEADITEILKTIEDSFGSEGNDADSYESRIFGNNEICLSPFVLLSFAFPSIDKDLRTLHSLIGKVVKGGGRVSDSEELEIFWRSFCKRVSTDELLRIKKTYLAFLTRLITFLKMKSSVECVERILGCNEAVDVITREEKEDSSEG